MISSGIESADIKIPMIIAHDEQVRFGVLALSPQQSA
jgi:hypothetical protein